jgi:hypothetical protein
MRTRRIAIGCRRTGSANPVSIAPSGSAGAPDLWPGDFLSLVAPLPSRTPGTAGTDDLTLADLTVGRRDLTWNQNPGWPAAMELDWTAIARGHQPRHARRRLPAVPNRAFLWTGAGIIAAVLLTILLTLIGELLA